MSRTVNPLSIAYEAIPIPEQDLAGARRLLQEAGYPNGFEMQIVLAPWGGKSEEIGEGIASWWEQIGVKVNRVSHDVGRHVQLWSGHLFEAPTAAVIYSDAAPFPTVSGFMNREGLFHLTHDQEVIDLGTSASRAETVDEYVRFIRQANRLIVESSWYPSLFLSGDVYAIRKGLGGDQWVLGGNGYSINVKALLTGKPY